MEKSDLKLEGLAEAVARWENECIKEFASFEKRDYGILYYNLENVDSYDSNHALIYDYSSLEGALDDIERFYSEKGLVPRIFQANRNGEEEELWPRLKERGYIIEDIPDLKFYSLTAAADDVAEKGEQILEFRVAPEISDDIKEVFRLEEGGDWNIKKLDFTGGNKKFKLISGHNKQGKAVVVANIRQNSEVAILEDVITHPDQRRKGYGSALIDFICRYHRKQSSLPLTLFADDEGAIRIYEKFGFRELPFPYKSWTSYKG